MLEIFDLSLKKGDEALLHPLSVSIEAQKITALVGASGAGKSTLLRCIMGLEPTFLGGILLDNRPIRPHLDASLMMQEDLLLPWKNLLDNVALPLELAGIRDKSAAKALLVEVGLEEDAHKMPAELSHGMRQRAALARTLVAAKPLLCLDEPFASVDALTRRNLQELLLRLVRERNLTVILVTHDISEALTLADSIICLKEGKLLSHKPSSSYTSDEIYASL